MDAEKLVGVFIDVNEQNITNLEIVDVRKIEWVNHTHYRIIFNFFQGTKKYLYRTLIFFKEPSPIKSNKQLSNSKYLARSQYVARLENDFAIKPNPFIVFDDIILAHIRENKFKKI